MKTSKITIFIVDDHPLMRQALKTSILTEDDMEVVGTAVDGVKAIEAIPDLQPNIVIMDLMMPNMGGLAAIMRLSQICPDVNILALSSLEKEDAIFKAVQMGARGYLTKDVQHEELINAIRTVSAGKSYLPDRITEKLMRGVRQNLAEEEPIQAVDSLTKREMEVLTLLGKGYSNVKIANYMVIAESTVRVHLHQIMKKMDFENRRDVVLFAARRELEK